MIARERSLAHNTHIGSHSKIEEANTEANLKILKDKAGMTDLQRYISVREARYLSSSAFGRSVPTGFVLPSQKEHAGELTC
jgi:superfamily II helicase